MAVLLNPMLADTVTAHPEPPDLVLVEAVLRGETARFEELIVRHQPRVFGTVRRYARRESEVEDIVQEVFLKAFQKLSGFRREAPFEHWLMTLTVRTCYDFLRSHRRNREHAFTELSSEETDWLDRHAAAPERSDDDAQAARTLVNRVLEQLAPAHRLIIQLLEIEERPVKEIAALTGWSVPTVKVRAFRARAEMKKILARLQSGKFL